MLPKISFNYKIILHTFLDVCWDFLAEFVCSLLKLNLLLLTQEGKQVSLARGKNTKSASSMHVYHF